MTLGQVRKTVAVAVGAGITWAGTVIESPQAHISAGEWLLLATAVATVLGVYGVTNDPAPWDPPEFPGD